MSCMERQQVVSVYTKQLSALTIQLFIPWRRENTVSCSPCEGTAGELWGGGFTHNVGLVHEAVG